VTAAPLGAHLPWAQVDDHLDGILAIGLVPEIAIKGPELDALSGQRLLKISQALAEAGVQPTIHAPFFDLNPGALDPLVRQVTCQRLSQALTLAETLDARLMVIHPGVDKWRYPNLEQTWLTLAKASLLPLVEQAAACNCQLALENIYEETPDTLVQLVEEIAAPGFGHCYDVGHWHVFGKRPMAAWLKALGPKLLHLHLHDNCGRHDEHLPVGDGTIDFTPLFEHLKGCASLPSMTLEAHTAEHLRRSLRQVTRYL